MSIETLHQTQEKGLKAIQQDYDQLSDKYKYQIKIYEELAFQHVSLKVNYKAVKDHLKRLIDVHQSQIKSINEHVEMLERENRILITTLKRKETSLFSKILNLINGKF